MGLIVRSHFLNVEIRSAELEIQEMDRKIDLLVAQRSRRKALLDKDQKELVVVEDKLKYISNCK